jgi:hypothetical protein
MSFLQPQSEEWIRHKLKGKNPKAPRVVMIDRKGSATIHVKQKKPSGTIFVFPGDKHKHLKHKEKRKK